jgi:uncharacterized protein (TIGR03437 family)
MMKACGGCVRVLRRLPSSPWLSRFLLVAVAALSWSASAQTWDTSGNGMLNGPYYIRQVLWQVGDDSGDLGDGVSVYGDIIFNGAGSYQFTGNVMDPGSSATPQAYSVGGTYSISASGYGFMDNLLIGMEITYGLVSQGIFIGSSTENLSGDGVNDLAIAAPITSTPATAATFNGSYTMVDFDSPTGMIFDSRDSLFTLTANGSGNVTMSGSGWIAQNGGTVTRQSLGTVKYTFQNGAGVIQVPGSSLFNSNNPDSVLISGNYYVYISPDGNFIFGGSPNGWDMFVGVRTTSAVPTNFTGLYYQAGMDQDLSQLADDFADLDSYFGSLTTTGLVSTIVGHQRLFDVFDANTFDFTYSDTYPFNTGSGGTTPGTVDDPDTGQHYVFGLNGALRVGVGSLQIGTLLGINVAVAAPSIPATGAVFIDPQGVVNSGSFAPFTADLAPGELVSIVGSGLSAKTDSNSFFPTTLDGVQVMINNVPAPILYVSPTLLNVMVPYETTAAVASIQVNNNGALSNTVTNFVGLTQPGIFPQSFDGVIYVSAQDVTTNYTLITPTAPANAGDTIVVYLTGLGTMNPAVADGAIGPSNPPAQAVNTITATIGGTAATVGFAGLTPGSDGLGQVNLTVPSGLTAGLNILEIMGPDSDNFEALISIGSGTSLAVPAAHAATRYARAHRAQPGKKALPAKIKPLSQPLNRTPGVHSNGRQPASITGGVQ